jgi:hypothetical protein
MYGSAVYGVPRHPSAASGWARYGRVIQSKVLILSGQYGECLMGLDGRWVERPGGSQPVLLSYKGM